MEIAVGKVVGKLGPGRWGQVHDFTPEEGEKRESRGRLVAAISLAVVGEEDQVEMVTQGREALARLHEMYFGESEGEAGERLKQAVKKVADEFGGMEVAAVVVVGEKLVVFTVGGAGIWVSRLVGGERREGWLVRVGEEGGKSFTGVGEPGEVLIIGTRGFWLNLSEGTLTALARKAETSFEDAVEMLGSEEQAGEDEGGGAGAMIRVQSLKFNVQSVEKDDEARIIPKESRPDGGIKNIWLAAMKKIAGRVYVHAGDKQEQRKKMMYAGVGFMVLMLLLFGGGQFVASRRQQNIVENSAGVEKIVFDFSEAKAMVSLNPARSRQLLREVKSAISGMGSGEKPDKIREIENEWEEVWNRASGVVVVETEEVIDLGLIREGLKGAEMEWNEGKLVVLDSEGGRLVEVEPKTGAGKILAGGSELVGTRKLAAYPGKTIMMGNDGLWQVVGDKKQVIIKNDGHLEKMRAVGIWSGNIYALEGEMIWRYLAAGEGFGVAKEWVAEGQAGGLKDGSEMAIDGSIWIAGEGLVMKYTRGGREEFELGEMEEKWKGPLVFFTSENVDNLYILEKEAGRIWVVGKNGDYVKQVKGEEIGKALGLVVDEKEGKGYILVGERVMKFDV